MLNNPPKLFRPIVDVEVREEGNGGVGRATSSSTSFVDSMVEDLPRRPRRVGGTTEDGEDLADVVEAVESCRSITAPGDAKFIDEVARAT
jgi:hypothetical protein